MALIECHSSTALKREFETIRATVILPESEESWEKIAKGITRITNSCNNGALDFPKDLTFEIRTISRPLVNAMCSERGRLSGAAMDMLRTLACGLGGDAEPLIPIFLPTLITLCTRTNKVSVTRARACILAFIENTQLPAILPYLVEAAKDKSVTLRIVAAESVLSCLNCFNPPDLEKESRATMIEGVIKLTAKDANADVRRVSRKLFEAYKALMPSRVEKFVGPLTPVTKKYLEIKAQSSSSAPSSRPPSSASTASLVDKTLRAPKAKAAREETMPPPPYIPVRATAPIRPPSAPSTTNTSAQATGLPRSGPSRAHGPPHKPELGFVAKPASTEPARRVAPQPPPAAAVPSGPHRVNRANNDPSRSDGPLRRLPSKPRPPQMTEANTEQRSRPQGGARRVPLPPPSAPKVEDAASKEVSDNAQSLPKSTNAAGALSRSASSQLAPGPVPAKLPSKTDEKPRPVPKAPVKATTTHVRAPSTQSIASSAQTTKESARSLDKKTSVSQPTLAQIARAKAAAADRQVKEAEKPVWGRSKSGSTTKGLAVKGKTTPAARSKTPSGPQATVKPSEIPLPPSPTPDVHDLPPLPPSPTVNSPPKVDEAASFSSSPTTSAVVAEEKYLDALPTIQVPSANTPAGHHNFPAPAATPISSLLTSIQQGFLFTPCSPLSPPQSYLPLNEDDASAVDSPTPSANVGAVVTEGKLPGVGWGGNDDGRQVLSEVDMN
ncbi:hypothetical protein HWV62_33333 [Athelia sp. TMB]|nr:hypothetical protein HWV62_33333 [Athelia sp. TMB]